MDAEAFDHTPLPWRISDDEKSIVCAYYHDEEPEVCRRPQKSWRGGWDADAEFIVMAANAHDRLIEALEKIAADEWHSCRLEKACRLTSEHDPDCAISIARAALALARGEVE